MTIITVTFTEARLTANQRRELAETLTDAVLIPEVGQLAVQARIGFQVPTKQLGIEKRGAIDTRSTRERRVHT